jgi:hypothetical protein
MIQILLIYSMILAVIMRNTNTDLAHRFYRKRLKIEGGPTVPFTNPEILSPSAFQSDVAQFQHNLQASRGKS